VIFVLWIFIRHVLCVNYYFTWLYSWIFEVVEKNENGLFYLFIFLVDSNSILLHLVCFSIDWNNIKCVCFLFSACYYYLIILFNLILYWEYKENQNLNKKKSKITSMKLNVFLFWKKNSFIRKKILLRIKKLSLSSSSFYISFGLFSYL
jgi:hypothetical protein